MHTFATLWIASCIHLHNFAIGHEKHINPEADSFFIEGQRLLNQDRREEAEWREEQRLRLENDEVNYEGTEAIELLEGKIRREEMKRELFTYLGQ